MIKTATFTIGALMIIGGFVMAALTVAGAAMSDNPSASEDAMGEAKFYAGVGAVGIAAVIGANFIP